MLWEYSNVITEVYNMNRLTQPPKDKKRGDPRLGSPPMLSYKYLYLSYLRQIDSPNPGCQKTSKLKILTPEEDI